MDQRDGAETTNLQLDSCRDILNSFQVNTCHKNPAIDQNIQGKWNIKCYGTQYTLVNCVTNRMLLYRFCCGFDILYF